MMAAVSFRTRPLQLAQFHSETKTPIPIPPKFTKPLRFSGGRPSMISRSATRGSIWELVEIGSKSSWLTLMIMDSHRFRGDLLQWSSVGFWEMGAFFLEQCAYTPRLLCCLVPGDFGFAA
ncbi:hypothetical protein RchiOBHm_Chr2g0121271 [Rosa chinensis]|uniref:Uncharacterized protein n=1 Tax=Rosa chinensis TaxID=74649 RepID=A0A2P6RSH9_ROSCH|nr:hypothetical protein RchiOBHm_Chr2g0121271 [Rosa chinensis]